MSNQQKKRTLLNQLLYKYSGLVLVMNILQLITVDLNWTTQEKQTIASDGGESKYIYGNLNKMNTIQQIVFITSIMKYQSGKFKH